MKSILQALFICVLGLSACTVEPKPIIWGKDACNYCKMNIVDKMHAAEYVTTKGKVYKYDAIECLINELIDKDFPESKFTLIRDYGNNGEFTEAKKATYLISEGIPSPMGGFLSGFSNKSKAQNTLKEKEGKLYNWKQIVELYKAQK